VLELVLLVLVLVLALALVLALELVSVLVLELPYKMSNKVLSGLGVCVLFMLVPGIASLVMYAGPSTPSLSHFLEIVSKEYRHTCDDSAMISKTLASLRCSILSVFALRTSAWFAVEAGIDDVAIDIVKEFF